MVATMYLVRLTLALVLAALTCAASWAAPISEAEFEQRVASLYDFEPHKLSQPEISGKSDELDVFWSQVQADPATLLPFLRRALRDPTRSAFFYYDGSKLLLSLSKAREDQALALQSIAKADLEGIQSTDYLQTVHWLASNGFDTREAAFRILAFPDFKAFIPGHSLTLGQNYCLVYMLFPMQETVFVGDLATRLMSERNIQSQKSLLLALWYASHPTARAALEQFAGAPASSPEAKAFAQQLLARKPSVLARTSARSVKSLREERRKIMSRPISDESLIEFDHLTEKLLAKL